MDLDDHVCLCYRVSLRKIQSYLQREDPPVASLISECLDAGTGCGWCVPILEKLHANHKSGKVSRIVLTAEQYAADRKAFTKSGERPERYEDNVHADDTTDA